MVEEGESALGNSRALGSVFSVFVYRFVVKGGNFLKKFQFSLETMLGYRQQVLEAKQQDYAMAQGQAQEQEDVVRSLEAEYDDFDAEFTQKKIQGMAVIEAMTSESCLRALELDIKKQYVTLRKLEAVAEEKRQEMIQAKQDASSAEKLKEKKLEAYNKEVAKSEEAFIDEMVAASWAMNRN